jgi:predicted cupin superfamily sugar epimerase
MRPTAQYWIDTLQMTTHVEGGAFKETYRAKDTIPKSALSAAFAGDRNFSTAIYFLLQQAQFSALHRISADEVWHFYEGDPLEVIEIKPSGELTIHLLGRNPEAGEVFQCVIEAGSWFGSRVAAKGEYSLVGCTVAPGFDFADFELAKRDSLLNEFPQYPTLIEQLTY